MLLSNANLIIALNLSGPEKSFLVNLDLQILKFPNPAIVEIKNKEIYRTVIKH